MRLTVTFKKVDGVNVTPAPPNTSDVTIVGREVPELRTTGADIIAAEQVLERLTGYRVHIWTVEPKRRS